MQIICRLFNYIYIYIYIYLHTLQVAKCTNVLMHISKWASWHRKTPPVQVAGKIELYSLHLIVTILSQCQHRHHLLEKQTLKNYLFQSGCVQKIHRKNYLATQVYTYIHAETHNYFSSECMVLIYIARIIHHSLYTQKLPCLAHALNKLIMVESKLSPQLSHLANSGNV